MQTLEDIEGLGHAIEIQASFGALNNAEPWGATVTTYEHGPVREPGSETGSGTGQGKTLDDAIARAAEQYQQA